MKIEEFFAILATAKSLGFTAFFSRWEEYYLEPVRAKSVWHTAIMLKTPDERDVSPLWCVAELKGMPSYRYRHRDITYRHLARYLGLHPTTARRIAVATSKEKLIDGREESIRKNVLCILGLV